MDVWELRVIVPAVRSLLGDSSVDMEQWFER